MRKSSAAGGPNEALLGDGAARKLTNAALRVLAEDLEESLGDAAAAVASSRGADKAAKALAQAGELLEQLRSQGRTGSRQDQVLPASTPFPLPCFHIEHFQVSSWFHRDWKVH